jgi:hypothetical protein
MRNPGCAAEAAKVAKAARGAPSAYTPKLAAELVEGFIDGKSLRTMTIEKKIKLSTVYEWLEQHPDFSEAMARARKLCATTHFEDTMHLANQLADGETPENNAKVRAHELRFKVLQYRAERLDPLQYGARQQVGFDDTTTKLLANLAASTASLPLSGQLIEGERVDDQKELPWNSES